MTAPPTHRVALCDDDQAFRALVRAVLAREADISVVGECGDGHQCVERIAATQPDAVLLDLDMPRLSGIAAIPKLIDASPATKIIVVTSQPARRAEAAVRRLGASAFVEKSGAELVGRLPQVLRAALAG
ncbi:MAG TPA: response regulator transcription factor [Solirubrobacteraceae bacterium]|jgi:DNA-binding NarL/FixJ family response regulator